FKVNTDRGGKGTLAINPKGPSAGYSVEKRETHANEYECSFVPWEIGKTMVEILWGGFHVPGSPFQMLIEAALTSNVCNATGEGLKRAKLDEVTTFQIISSQSGLIQKRELHVSITGVHAQVPVKIKDNHNGTYTCSYTIEQSGAYIIAIKFRKEHIPGSPFKLNVHSGPKAEGIKMIGDIFKERSVLLSGRAHEFKVDARNAGQGTLD
ncbi:filamin/ABP280 repeat domain-containing protein, partial [Salmonella sp. s54836]|uniref:filamin/ABP280 repeat-containing protein n=1 Tax=Salmonella sp. s54836 TaxID=3159673 RepID=UPI00398021B4